MYAAQSVILSQPPSYKTGHSPPPCDVYWLLLSPRTFWGHSGKVRPFLCGRRGAQFLPHFCGFHTLCRRGKGEAPEQPSGHPGEQECRRMHRHYLCVSPCLGATEPAGGWGDPAEVVGTSGSGSPAEGCPPVSRQVGPRSQAECFPVRVQTGFCTE